MELVERWASSIDSARLLPLTVKDTVLYYSFHIGLVGDPLATFVEASSARTLPDWIELFSNMSSSESCIKFICCLLSWSTLILRVCMVMSVY